MYWSNLTFKKGLISYYLFLPYYHSYVVEQFWIDYVTNSGGNSDSAVVLLVKLFEGVEGINSKPPTNSNLSIFF